MAIDVGIRNRSMAYVVEDCLDERRAIVVHCGRISKEEMAMLMLKQQKRIVDY